MTRNKFIDRIREDIKGLTKYFTYPLDYENALTDAEAETGWSPPITDTFQILWLKNRARRHLFFMLQSESARKHKYGKASLDQVFTHFSKLVEIMDKGYLIAIENNPEKFAGVDQFKAFGLVASPGFAYEPLTGRNITHSDDQKVTFSPNDDS